MVYYGKNCKDAELRAENKNSTCKDIHNDQSAAALQWIGVIFMAPLLFYCVCKCPRLFGCIDGSVGPDE